MLILLWSVAWLLLIVCRRAKARLTAMQRPVRLAVVSLASDLLTVFVLVGSVFLGLAWWAILTDASDAQLQQLWKAEQTLTAVRASARYLRVPSAIATAVLIACAVLAHRRPHSRMAGVYAWFSLYQKHTKRLLLTVAVLASFSIFGGTVEGTEARIEARLKNVSEQYSSFKRELVSASQYAAAEAVIRRIADEHPPSWTAVRDRENTIAAAAVHLDYLLHELKSYAELAPQPSRFPDAPRGTTENQSSERQTPSANDTLAPEEQQPDSRPADDVPPAEATGFNEDSLSALRAALRAYRERALGEIANLLSTPLGQKLPASVLDLLLSHKHWDVLKAVTDDYPLLGAVLGVLERALIDGLADRIRSAVVQPAPAATAIDVDLGARLQQAADNVAQTAVLDWAGAEERVSEADAHTRIELAELQRAVAAAEAAVRHEVRRIQSEEAQLRAAVDRRWEAEGLEFDRRFGISFMKQPPDAPPSETLAHRQGRALMRTVLETVAAEPDWRARRQLLTQLATAVIGPEPYPERGVKLRELAAEPERRRLLQNALENERVSGFPEGTFSAWFENARERTERLERANVRESEIAERVRRESDAFREHERQLLAKRFGFELEPSFGGIPARPLKIGRFEIPAFSTRALRMLARARVR